jgi:hypothetical protein
MVDKTLIGIYRIASYFIDCCDSFKTLAPTDLAGFDVSLGKNYNYDK